MIYFYIWVLIVLGSIVAVPVLAFMEKSKQKKLMEANAPAPTQDTPAMDDVSMPMAEDAEAAVAPDDFGAFPASGGEDFSAFEDFK